MQTATDRHIATQAVQIVGKHFLSRFRKTALPQTPKDFMRALTDIETECLTMLKQRIDPVYGNIPWVDDDEFDPASQKTPAPYDCYWLCDTMDGAIQYLQHIPGWTINLVLVEKGVVHFSVIYDPLTGECFSAELNHGASLNGEKMTILEKTSAEMMVAVLEYGHQLKTSNHWKEELSSSFLHLTEHFGTVRNYGPHGLQLAYTGAGRIDLFVQLDLDTHNWLAGMLIAKEAGATIRNADGTNWKWGDESLIVGSPSAIALYFQHQKNTSCI